MKYRYFATYLSVGEDCGVCYDRAELDATVADALSDADCVRFAWERLDRYGEPSGELHIEKSGRRSASAFESWYFRVADQFRSDHITNAVWR